MGISTLKLWEKLGFVRRELPADTDTDIEAITTYLDDINHTVETLRKQFRILLELRRDARVLTDENLIKENLAQQVQIYDKLLSNYQYFDIDTDINGIRMKNIAKRYMAEIKKHKLYEVLENIKKKDHWIFNW